MKEILLRLVVFLLRVAYAPMRRFAAQNKITLISRQSDEVPADFILIQKYLTETKPDIEVRILAKRLNLRNPSAALYPFHMVRQMYHIATSKVVVLDGYCIVASIVDHNKNTKIIQMWHAAAAIKKFGWQIVGQPSGSDPATANIMNMHGHYDFVVAPSKTTGQIYEQAFRVGSEKIVYHGLPHLSDLIRPNPAMLEEIKAAYGLDPTKKTILYVPTFRDGKRINLDALSSEIDYSRYELVVRIHPIDTLPPHDDRVVYAKGHATQTWMQLADIVITDYSSLMVEAAILDKPLYLYVYDLEEYKRTTGLNMDFDKEPISAVVFAQADALVRQLSRPYDHTMLSGFRNKYIEIDVPNCARDFGEFIIELIDGVSANEEKN